MKHLFTTKGLFGLIFLLATGVNATASNVEAKETIDVNNTSYNLLISSPFSTLVVTNSNDSGAGSLRHAIANASQGDTIKFATSTIGQAITLESGPLIIDVNLNIVGKFRNATIIDGNDLSHVFQIEEGIKCTINDLKITNGKAENFGAGILNNGQLELNNVDIDNCKIQSNQPGTGISGGGAALANFGSCVISNSKLRGNSVSGVDSLAGGAILNIGDLNIINSQITGNYCASLQSAYGGGIYNSGTIEMHNSTLSSNNISIFGPDQSAYSESAGAIVSSNSNVTVKNSILWGNSSSAFTEVYLLGINLNPSDPYFSNTLIENLATDNFEGDETPLFVQPINTSDATTEGDFNLMCTSPLIDQGKNQYYLSPIAEDIAGNQRIQNGDGIDESNIDLGAYEYAELVLTVDSQTACDTYTWTNGVEYTESITDELITLTSSLGCDSLAILDLTVNFNTEETDMHQACGQFTWSDGSVYEEDNSTATIISENESGCLHTLTLDVTFTEIEAEIIIGENLLTASQPGLEYQWLDCNNSMQPILGANSQTFQPEIGGNYALKTSFGNCFEYSECTASMTLGVEESNIFNEVSVFPNPTAGTVNIKLGSLREVDLRLMDVTGKEIATYNSGLESQFSIEIDKAPGIYFIELSIGTDRQHIKVIKQ